MRYYRGFRGFGQEGDAGDGDVMTDGNGDEIVVDTSTGSIITFNESGSVTIVGEPAATWWTSLKSAVGAAPGDSAATVLAKAQKMGSGKSMWMWAAIIGIPVVGAAAYYGGKKL